MSARFTPPAADAQAAPSRPQHYTTDPACWRSYVEALIYGAATSPACYAREVLKRKRHASQAVAERYGADMGRELRRMFPDIDGIVTLARAATGEDLPNPEHQRQRFAATVAACQTWLPKCPPTGRQLASAERDRRAGITDEQRQANADELAASF